MAASASTRSPQQFTQNALGVLNVLSSVLAVRFTLLVSVVGAIGLALIAIRTALPFQLGALALYGGLIVVPLIWLAARR